VALPPCALSARPFFSTTCQLFFPLLDAIKNNDLFLMNAPDTFFSTMISKDAFSAIACLVDDEQVPVLGALLQKITMTILGQRL
jgi:hypothetical protein